MLHQAIDLSGSRAFNLGSDARLAGLPEEANPYPGTEPRLLARWQEEWDHIDRHWGEESYTATALRPVRRLP